MIIGPSWVCYALKIIFSYSSFSSIVCQSVRLSPGLFFLIIAWGVDGQTIPGHKYILMWLVQAKKNDSPHRTQSLTSDYYGQVLSDEELKMRQPNFLTHGLACFTFSTGALLRSAQPQPRINRAARKYRCVKHQYQRVRRKPWMGETLKIWNSLKPIHVIYP